MVIKYDCCDSEIYMRVKNPRYRQYRCLGTKRKIISKRVLYDVECGSTVTFIENG